MLIINALMVLKLSCSPSAEFGVENIISTTLGDDLTELNTITDTKGSVHSLHKLVYSDCREETRRSIKRHILE